MNKKTQSLTLSAMFIAQGILLPFLFHIVNMGKVFLPMYWPIAACAFFLPVPYAIAVAVLTPSLSFAISGMPPPPILYIMISELVFLTGIIGILYLKTRYGIFWLVLSGLIVSRVILYLATTVFAPILGLPVTLISSLNVLQGMPGVAIMLIAIPFFVYRIKRDSVFNLRKVYV